MSVDFKKIKLLSIGDYKNDKNGNPTIKVTEKVLDGMVNAFNDLKDNTLPDLIIDHKDTKDERDKAFTVPDKEGKPTKVFGRLPFSVGKITNLQRLGDSLYGDFINVFEPIKNAMKDKLLTSLSSEFFLDIKSNVTDKVYDGVLTAVAILPGGTWAELFDKFKPYMFNLDELQEPVKFNFESFNTENKIVFNLQNYLKDYFIEKLQAKETKMSKEEYQKKVQKFMDKKMKCANYEQFLAMNEGEQKEYMSMLEDKYNKFSLAGLGELEVPNVENEKQKFSMEDLMKKFESLDSENKELKQNLFSLVNKTDKKLDEENNLLKQQIQEIKSQEKRKEVIKFVNDKLIESNKFDVADREKLENGLTAIAVSSNQPVKFSVGGVETVTDTFAFVAEMLEKAQVKNTFSHSPIVAKGENGLTVTRQEIEKSNGANPEDLLQDKKIRFAHKDKDFNSMSESELQAIYEAEGII